MKKQIAAACLFASALSAPALAQEQSSPAAPSTNAQSAPGAFLTEMDPGQWRGSKLVGVDVYGSENSKIGDISEVILDRSGQVKAIVIGVGGFLGLGEKNVAVPWDKVQWNAGGERASAVSSAQPAGERAASRDVAQTATGASQTSATGGATLSSAPASETNAAPTTTTTSAASGSSAPVAQDYPERALVAMNKQDLQRAPDFRYASQASAGRNGAASGR